LKVPRRYVDGELYWHVHKLKRNQNKDGNNCRSLWQGEWNHLLAFAFVQDRALLWATTIVACIVVVKAHCNKFVRVGSTMTTSAKVRKPSLVMTISICFHVWQEKRWKTFLYTWTPFSDAIVTTISQNVSWVVVCSLPH